MPAKSSRNSFAILKTPQGLLAMMFFLLGYPNAFRSSCEVPRKVSTVESDTHLIGSAGCNTSYPDGAEAPDLLDVAQQKVPPPLGDQPRPLPDDEVLLVAVPRIGCHQREDDVLVFPPVPARGNGKPEVLLGHERIDGFHPPRGASLSPDQPGVPEELYDLASDPEELKNLAGKPKHADRLGRLREALTAELKRTAAPAVMLPPTRLPEAALAEYREGLRVYKELAKTARGRSGRADALRLKSVFGPGALLRDGDNGQQPQHGEGPVAARAETPASPTSRSFATSSRRVTGRSYASRPTRRGNTLPAWAH